MKSINTIQLLGAATMAVLLSACVVATLGLVSSKPALRKNGEVLNYETASQP